jgi:hypothetical protein
MGVLLPLACPACVLAARLSMRRKSTPYLASVDAAIQPAGPAPTIRTSVWL